MRKSVLMSSAVAAAFLGVIGVAGLQAGLAAPSPSVTSPVKVAEKVDNFQLADQTRLAHELYYFKAAPAIVVMSQVNGSSLSRQAAIELQKVADNSGGKKFSAASADELKQVYDTIARQIGYEKVEAEITEQWAGVATLFGILAAIAAISLGARWP